MAAGLLLVGAIGCSRDDPTAHSRSAPGFLPTRSSRLIEDAPAHATPSPAAETRLPDPVRITTAAAPDSGVAPLTVKFTATIQGGPTGLRYRWEFGDHTPAVRRLRAEHTYQEPGDYTATFLASGPDVEESESISITVTAVGFAFDIETSSDIGTAPLTVEFMARFFEDRSGPFSFLWDFGDGDSDVSNPTTHMYSRAGEYTARITVTNADGHSVTRDVQIQVDPPEDAEE